MTAPCPYALPLITAIALDSGANDLVVFALNEGTSGPNTVAIAIDDVEIQSFSPGMLTGEAVQINF